MGVQSRPISAPEAFRNAGLQTRAEDRPGLQIRTALGQAPPVHGPEFESSSEVRHSRAPQRKFLALRICRKAGCRSPEEARSPTSGGSAYMKNDVPAPHEILRRAIPATNG